MIPQIKIETADIRAEYKVSEQLAHDVMKFIMSYSKKKRTEVKSADSSQD